MTDPNAFAKLVPGFDFLQGLVKNAGAALPAIGQWVAPTIDPAELEKRIEELRTVQFWLEQNTRMIGATIQALEVQRMTLSTLKTMNVQMEGLRDSLQIRVPTPVPPAPTEARPAPAPAPESEAEGTPAEPEPAAAAPGVVDPLQWWGALTKQFTELATTAMKDTASDAARQMTGRVAKTSLDPGAAATNGAVAPKRTPAAKKKPAARAVAAKKAAARR